MGEQKQMNQIAIIDLASRQTKIRPVPDKLRERFLGGRGINMAFLYSLVEEKIDPLGPENPLIFGAGALTGSGEVTAARLNISAKSPETGILGDGSMGGFFGPELRKAGFDHLIILNKSDKPVYLYIQDGQIAFRDASHLAKLDIHQTFTTLRQEVNDRDVQIVCIGPAGRKLVAFACVCGGYGGNAVGRTGMGAVMGSKNLWAVVVRGSSSIPCADPGGLVQAIKKHYRQVTTTKGFHATSIYGTLIRLNNSRLLGLEGGKNFQVNVRDSDGLDIDDFLNRYEVGKKACFGCPIHCKHVWRIKSGEMKGLTGIGLEFNAAGALHFMAECEDWETIMAFYDRCNRYGLDVASASAYIAILMELYDRGIITKEDTGGLPYTWGSREAILGFLDQVNKREHIGDVVANGLLKAAEIIGKDIMQYVIHSKGLTIEARDLRAHKGQLLGEVVSSRGGDHLRGRFTMEDFHLPPKVTEAIMGQPVPSDPRSYKGKAWPTVWTERLCAVVDSVGICKFASKWMSPGLLGFDEMAESFEAVTGIPKTGKEIMSDGERIYTLEKLFNVREGIRRKDDKVPDRYHEPLRYGPYQGEYIDDKEFQAMLDEYYELSGLDRDGKPLPETLERLHLDDEEKLHSLTSV
jgi:aldehyde:ferredoxin oxidoreductase